MKVGERGLTSERYLSFVTVTDDDANTDDLPRFDVKSSPYWRSLGFRHIVNDLVVEYTYYNSYFAFTDRRSRR